MTQLLIRQSELSEINDLQRELAYKKHHLDDLRSSVSVMLREGIQVEEGRLDARMVTRMGRAVSWKLVCLEKLGQAAFDAVKRTFKTHTYLELEVLEPAVPPLWRGREGSGQAQNQGRSRRAAPSSPFERRSCGRRFLSLSIRARSRRFLESDFGGVAEGVEDAEQEVGGNVFGVAIQDRGHAGARSAGQAGYRSVGQALLRDNRHNLCI